ncbi:MAG: hypothetical protein JXR10_10620 [Cyclobacteriaceae bacterium]
MNNSNTINLIGRLQKIGYKQQLLFQKNRIYLESKSLALNSNDLFFVDAGYFNKVSTEYIFAISSPMHKVKGCLLLNQSQYDALLENGFEDKFSFDVEHFNESKPALKIKRQYGMRKISQSEFDPERYIFRVGFSDFPSCPFGNTFMGLGYDLKKKEYVRLSPAILKQKNLTTENNSNPQ